MSRGERQEEEEEEEEGLVVARAPRQYPPTLLPRYRHTPTSGPRALTLTPRTAVQP